jgi:NAD-dependent dihydropyrimidine dehydrogenase PreA subunit
MITEDKFRGQVFCDIHSVPESLCDNSTNNTSGQMVDSYLATVRGIKPDSFTANDVTLLSTFVRVKMYRKETDEFAQLPNLEDFYGKQRWHYDFGDIPAITHPYYQIDLTKREADMWTEGKECVGCNLPGHLCPTGDINFTADLKQGFVCSDCFKKAG